MSFSCEERQDYRLYAGGGIALKLPVKNEGSYHMLWEIFAERVYVKHGLSIGVNDLVVDIGANVGIFTVFAAKQTRSRVIAYEPSTFNIPYLKDNVAINSLGNVSIFDLGVSGAAGTAELFWDTSCSGVMTPNLGPIHGSETVSVVSFAEVLKEAGGKIGFLKMDCEGPEGLIVRDNLSCFSSVAKVAMEVHDNVSVLSTIQIKAALESIGFTVFVDQVGSCFYMLYGVNQGVASGG